MHTEERAPDAGAPISRELDASAPLLAATPDAAPATPDAGLRAPASGGAVAIPADSGAPRPPPGLHGEFSQQPFEEVEAAYVVGYADEELGTTAVYLIDSPITCDQVSGFAWLASLPSDVQVIELKFPRTTAPGSVLNDALVSHAHGGTYSFSKVLATAHTLVVTRNSTGGVVEGTLQATFAEGTVAGSFKANLCPTGLSF
jgi:hypothetical protein